MAISECRTVTLCNASPLIVTSLVTLLVQTAVFWDDDYKTGAYRLICSFCVEDFYPGMELLFRRMKKNQRIFSLQASTTRWMDNSHACLAMGFFFASSCFPK